MSNSYEMLPSINDGYLGIVRNRTNRTKIKKSPAYFSGGNVYLCGRPVINLHTSSIIHIIFSESMFSALRRDIAYIIMQITDRLMTIDIEITDHINDYIND